MHEDALKLNESGGKLFEALTECILEDLYGKASVTAQPSCKTMHIKPDILVGPPARPTHVVLVTHATAVNNAGHKIDRGTEELFEIKTRFPTIPVAINLIWHSPLAWKDGYLKRMDEMFDANWVAFRDCDEYAASLPEMIATLKAMERADSDQYHSILRKGTLISTYKTSILAHLRSVTKKNVALWRAERQRHYGIIFDAPGVDTRLRKDLISITALRPELLRDLLQKGRAKVDPKTAQEIGTEILRRKTLSGSIVSLDDALQQRLHGASSFLGPKPFADLLCDISVKRWSSGTTVEGIDVAKARVEALLSACRDGKLLDLVAESWDTQSPLYSARCWPLYIGVAVIKALLDEDFGFLNAQRRALGDTHQAYRWDLLNRYARGESDCLSRADLSKVIKVFQANVNSLPSTDADSILKNESYLAQLALHRVKDENPLMLFVERTLSLAGIQYEGWPDQGPTTQCPFAVKANLASTSGLTSWHFKIHDGRLLHVLSSYSATHKDKEYCAKAHLSRYRWGGREFEKSSFGEVGLILDGKWKPSETSMFSSAGVVWFPSDNPTSWIEWLKKKRVSVA